MPRRAALSLTTCVLALVTALALLRAAVVVANPPVDPAVGNTAAVVRGFYDAVNDALRSGDAAALDAAVASGFVGHPAVPGVGPDRAGLARSLAALRAAHPNARLAVEDVVVAGDRAVAVVTLRGAGRGAFLGLPVDGGAPAWDPLDGLRVADGRVAELWGGPAGTTLLEPLARVPLGVALPTGQVVELRRLTLPPGRHHAPRIAETSRVFAVVAGALTLEVDPTAVQPGTDLALAVGDAVALLAPDRYALRVDGASAAVVLVVGIFPPDAANRTTTRQDPALPSASPPRSARALAAVPNAPGVEVEPLAGGVTTTFPSGDLTVAFGRATLAPGAAVALDGATGPALLCLEAGVVDAATVGGAAWVRRAANGASSDLEAGTLLVGDGALVPAGADLTLSNPGAAPAVALVVTILPDAGGAAGPWRSANAGGRKEVR